MGAVPDHYREGGSQSLSTFQVNEKSSGLLVRDTDSDRVGFGIGLPEILHGEG